MTTTEPIYAQERWFQLLKESCDKHGVNRVASMLGYNNHTGTSQILAGKYAGKTDRFAARVTRVFDRVVCPHTQQQVQAALCHETSQARAPLNNPMKMQQWRACQQCKNKPEV